MTTSTTQNIPIKIAITGRANAGKTTLIRTLMKAKVGEVEDRAGCSQDAVPYDCEGLQATFIDTPGFQNASAIAIYLDMLQENSALQMPPEWQKDMDHDLKALKAIEDSEVVLYVASLMTVPDNSHKQEISIIKKKCLKIVAIINQYQKELAANGRNRTKVEKRIELWKNTFNEQSIAHVIIFDAHWDNPAKVKHIYDSVEKNSRA